MQFESLGPYSAAWRCYRQWSRAFWIVFVFYLPGLDLVSRALGWRRYSNGAAIFLAAFVWMIAWAVIGYRKSNFSCPRCGEPFFISLTTVPGACHGSTIHSLAVACIAG
jgi:uncharacterized membrane protein